MKKKIKELDMPFQLCFKRQNAKSKVGTYMSNSNDNIIASTRPKYDITHKTHPYLGLFVTHEIRSIDATQPVSMY